MASDRNKEREKRKLERRLSKEKEGEEGGLPWKKIGALVIALAVAVGLIWTFKPWKKLPWATTGSGEAGPPIENLGENEVAFQFSCSFTYENADGNPVLENFEVGLPWPHVGLIPVGVPDNNVTPYWFGNVLVESNMDRPEIRDTYFENIQIGAKYSVLYEGDVEAENGESIQALGTRSEPPSTKFLLSDPYNDENILNKVIIEVRDFRAGEEVRLEGIFAVPEENATDVRIGDIGWPYAKNKTPEQKNAPVATVGWFGPSREIIITGTFHIKLEKWANGTLKTVEEFKETVPANPAYFWHVDRVM